MQKPRESGGGECESKQPREKNYKHVRKKSCLLDSKINLGRALNHPILFALGEENDPYFTNSYDLSFLFDDFMSQELGGLECEPRVVDVPSNFLPVISSWKQCQDESLIAQGSSTLSLLPCDVSLKCLDKIDVLDNNLLWKIDLNHVEPILYLKHDFVNSRMTHVNKIDFAKPTCDDSFVIGDLWHQELESLNAKSTFASYDDPFLRNPSIDKHVISIVGSNLKDEMASLHTKMSKFSLVRNFEFHNYVDENSRTKRIEIVDDFRTWYLLCFHCKMVRPFNGIGMFYGRFVKDFSTHMSFVGYVVIKAIIMSCSHVCAHVLKLLEQLRGAYFDKFLMLIDVMFYKIHVVFYKVHMSCVEHTLHAMHNSFWSHSSHNNDHFFKMLEQLSEHHVDNLDSLLGIIPCKLQENDLNIGVSFVLIAKFNFECDGGNWFVDIDCENHLLVSEMSFGFQSEINLLYGTMIFDLDSLDFVGVLDRDLRTNPSKGGGDDVNPGVIKKNQRTGFEDKSFHKEGEDDVNLGIHNHRIQRCRGHGLIGAREDGDMTRSQAGFGGLIQTSICLLRRCPNADPRPPSSSSSKYLRVGTSHAPNGVQMREIWLFDESRAELPRN